MGKKIKTCFTCVFFTFNESSPCGNGTCGDPSTISCDKKHYGDVHIRDESDAEACILKANQCPDFKSAGGE